MNLKMLGKYPYWDHGYITLRANLETMLGNYQDAINILNQGIKSALDENDFKIAGVIYGNISTLYNYLKDWENCEKYALESISTLNKYNDSLKHLSTPLINLGNVYSELGNNRNAIRYYKRALVLDSLNSDQVGQSITNCNIGLVFQEEGNYKKALKYIYKAYLIDSAYNHGQELPGTHTYLGQAYLNLGNTEKAKYHILSGRKLSAKAGLTTYREDNYKALIDLYVTISKPEKTKQYLTEYENYLDSIHNTERADAIARAQLLFEKTHEENIQKMKLEQANFRVSRRNNIIIFLTSISFIAIIISFYIVRSKNLIRLLHKRLKEQHTKLEKQHNELKTISADNNNLNSIIIHDVKSPIANIEGITNLMLKDIENFKIDQIIMLEMITNLSKNAIKLIDDLS
ncbi:MAG: tetratricopeptide repeat protein, partial [Bacteroidetes bacterium]|nr:tetratricopeptide repeat protein [Bacteroidota bacterium]